MGNGNAQSLFTVYVGPIFSCAGHMNRPHEHIMFMWSDVLRCIFCDSIILYAFE